MWGTGGEGKVREEVKGIRAPGQFEEDSTRAYRAAGDEGGVPPDPWSWSDDRGLTGEACWGRMVASWGN